MIGARAVWINEYIVTIINLKYWVWNLVYMKKSMKNDIGKSVQVQGHRLENFTFQIISIEGLMLLKDIVFHRKIWAGFSIISMRLGTAKTIMYREKRCSSETT